MPRIKLLIIIALTFLSALYPSFMWAKQREPKAIKKVFIPLKETQAEGGVDFSFTIGVGFLYFYHRKGNLSPIPLNSFPNFRGADFGSVPKFSYNKTPLYEAVISKRIVPWLKTGLSLSAQSEVSVESHLSSALTNASNLAFAQFRSNLQLYALMLKVYLENPYPFSIGSWTLGSYFALGAGAGWQSWTNSSLYETVILNSSFATNIVSLRNKFSANAVWTVDAGVYFQPITKEPTLKICLGCKYMDWGQMRQIGAIKNQEIKIGPFKPVGAKKVFSFSPYAGVTWSF